MAHFCPMDPSYCLGAAAVPVRMCLLEVILRWVLTKPLPCLSLMALLLALVCPLSFQAEELFCLIHVLLESSKTSVPASPCRSRSWEMQVLWLPTVETPLALASTKRAVPRRTLWRWDFVAV